MKNVKKEYQHPLVIRTTHWINVIALGIMVTSGLRIYNASPIWGFSVPGALTLGGWLAGARMWHFFGMWLFAANGVVWLAYNILSRHGRLTTLFRAKDAPGVIPMIQFYAGIRKKHPPAGKYNPLQKLAYTAIPAVALGSVLSGMAIYWPVQFGAVARLFGGYDAARMWHFIFMGALVLFLAGHILMVIIAGWSNFLSIITGWKRTTE